MTALKPCGTNGAWARHKKRGEPIDKACEDAHRAYQAEWARNARACYPLGTCTACGRERPIQRYNWCESCVSRWQNAGRPDTGPPPLKPRTGWDASLRVRREKGKARREDFAWLLLENGESVEAAGERVGIARSTAYAWAKEIQKAAAA